MASPFQQQSLRRKLIYTALILVLSFGTLVLRHASAIGLDSQAQALAIREESKGEVELTGSALRLTLTGSRGLAICSLWITAMDKQKRNEWNELELIVDSLTKLQPHFITPWLFQSWNLAYNVSVESDRIPDKYFYITRGILLLGEGERQNQGDPDLRFTLGFYNQHKIGLSDEANTHRCLYQLSCIDPIERDPANLMTQDEKGSQVVDMAKFEEFCRAHPMLVRRLRDELKRERPEDIIDFLRENRKVPSRYEDVRSARGSANENRSVLKPAEKQFPVLPPPEALEAGKRADPSAIDFDNFQVARDWYVYSIQPLPPPSTNLTVLPSAHDPTRYRVPRSMASHIFRGYPARAQTYVAEYLEREGWFDHDGWLITGWFPEDKFQNSTPARVGENEWGVRSWTDAHAMWEEHGVRNGLYIPPEELKSLQDLAKAYQTQHRIRPDDIKTAPPDRSPEVMKGYDAHVRLFWYEHYRAMTNFPHFYFRTQVEATPEAVAVRKAFFQAEEFRKAGDRELALERYREALPRWRRIMLDHPGFRQDSTIQEDSYEIALKYTQLVRDLSGKRFKELLVLGDFLAQAAARPPSVCIYLPPTLFGRSAQVEVLSALDGTDARGVPIIDQLAKETVRQRLGLPTPSQAPPQPPARP